MVLRDAPATEGLENEGNAEPDDRVRDAGLGIPVELGLLDGRDVVLEYPFELAAAFGCVTALAAMLSTSRRNESSTKKASSSKSSDMAGAGRGPRLSDIQEQI